MTPSHAIKDESVNMQPRESKTSWSQGEYRVEESFPKSNSYPAPVMQQIHKLSKDLCGYKELQQSQKNRAAVQFVIQEQSSSTGSCMKRAFGEQYCQEWEHTAAKISKSSLPSLNQRKSCVSKSFMNLGLENRQNFNMSTNNSQENVSSTKNNYYCDANSVGIYISDTCLLQQPLKPAETIKQLSSFPFDNISQDIEQHSDPVETVKQSGSFMFENNICQNDHPLELLKPDVSLFQEMRNLLHEYNVALKFSFKVFNDIAQKLNIKVDYSLLLSPDTLKNTFIYACTLKMDDVVISEASASSPNDACSEAAKYAFEKLTKSPFQLVLNDKNIWTLMGTTIHKVEKLSHFNLSSTDSQDGVPTTNAYNLFEYNSDRLNARVSCYPHQDLKYSKIITQSSSLISCSNVNKYSRILDSNSNVDRRILDSNTNIDSRILASSMNKDSRISDSNMNEDCRVSDSNMNEDSRNSDSNMNKDSRILVPKLDVLIRFQGIEKLLHAHIARKKGVYNNCLHGAAQKFNLKMDYIVLETGDSKQSSTFICTLKLNGILISEAKAQNQKQARLEAAKYAVEKLIKPSLQIILNDKNDWILIEKGVPKNKEFLHFNLSSDIVKIAEQDVFLSLQKTGEFLHALFFKLIRPVQAIYMIARELDTEAEFKITPDSSKKLSPFICTLKLHGILISSGEGTKKKTAMFEAAKEGVEKLMKPPFKLVLNDDNVLILMGRSVHEDSNIFSHSNLSSETFQELALSTGNNYSSKTDSFEINTSEMGLSQDYSQSVATIKQSSTSILNLKCLAKNMIKDNATSDDLLMFQNIQKIVKEYMLLSNNPFKSIKFAAEHLKIKANFKIALVPDELKNSPSYVCILKVHGALISEATAFKRQSACAKAAKFAVQKLMNTPLQLILNDKSTLVLNETKKIKPKPCSQSSSCTQAKRPCLTMSGSSKLPFPLDQNFSNQFLLFEKLEKRNKKGKKAMQKKSAAVLLANSALFCRVPIKYEFETLPSNPGQSSLIRCDLLLGGLVLSSATNITKAVAKLTAAKAAVVDLKKWVYTIKVNDTPNQSFVVSRSNVLDMTDSQNILSEDNIGYKMLKMMGWSGGGIGKQGNVGITEPIGIMLTMYEQNQGLGYLFLGIPKHFTSKIESLIQGYLILNTTSDLKFSSDFSNEEKQVIRRIAKKYNLKYSVVVEKNNRFISVNKCYAAKELLDLLLETGGSTEKYELIPPTLLNS